jgi:CRISPR/Cas system CSM-associated protein Csm2 small subunit
MYEASFNVATQLLAQDQPQQAEKKLKKALDLAYQAMIEDDEATMDLEKELVFIRFQLAYAQARQQKRKEAVEGFESIVVNW